MNKRENILKAALKLFVTQGEQATSMKLIGKEAKCGIGTMYNYFCSKDILINELFVEIKTKLFKTIIESLDTNAPVKQQFIAVWLKAVDFAISNHLEYRYLDMFSHTPKISKQSEEKVSKLIYPVIEIYEKGKREGIIKDLDTITLIIFTTGGITESIINKPDINEQEIKSIILMAWDAVKS